MAITAVTVDGVNLASLGLLTANVPELRDGVDTDFPTGRVPGRAGVVHLSSRGQPRERRFTIEGTIRANSHALVLDALDDLKWRCARQEVEVVFGDATTRYFTGILESAKNPVITPLQSQTRIGFRWTFLCADPYAYSTTETTLNFLSGTTTVTGLGTAPSFPVITIDGDITTLTLLYQTSAGIERGRMELEAEDGYGWDGELVIDCANQIITVDDEDASDLLAGGDFFSFDPIDGTSSVGPRIGWTRSGTATVMSAVYRAAWL